MKTFEVLLLGWVLDLRRHTVTQVVRAAGAVGYKHESLSVENQKGAISKLG